MRGIKFRAWDKDESIMTYLDLGNKNPDVSRLHIALLSDHLREPWGEVMQFTGLHDKNGKEIYEGDVVRYSGHFFGDSTEKECAEVVEWDEHDASYPWKLTSTGFYDGPNWCEVIGNIYENPELVAGTKKAPDLEGLKNCK